MQMGQYELQSYFKSLCNSFYIAYRQVKRLEREIEELETTSKEQELEMIETMEPFYEREIEEELQKYISLKCSKEEWQKERERLQTFQEDYRRKHAKLERKCEAWADLMKENQYRIESIIQRIKKNKYSVIITSEAELYALIAFYDSYPAKRYPIIKEKEQYKEEFSTEGTLYKDFLNAYLCDLQATAFNCNTDTENMHKVYKKYF